MFWVLVGTGVRESIKPVPFQVVGMGEYEKVGGWSQFSFRGFFKRAWAFILKEA